VSALIDASSLIVLAKVGALEAMFLIYGPVGVADAVWQEVVVQGKSRGKPDAWSVELAFERGWLDRIAPTDDEQQLVRQVRADYPVLGPGECESMACAQARHGRLIVEERKAKALAVIRGLDYTTVQMMPVEGYLARRLAYDAAVALLEDIGRAMNTDPAGLKALRAAMTALEAEWRTEVPNG
jgi:predicted nucleic acid-binding protein